MCACSGAPHRCAQATTACIWSRGTARTEWIAAPALACGEIIPCWSKPRSAARDAHRAASPSPKRSCGPASGSIPPGSAGPKGEAAGQVAGVEQRHPQAGLGGRLDQGPAHRVGVGVGPPARLVVQVVELAHAAHPGQRHLGVHGAGQPEVAVGVEPGRDLVHPLAPGPERAAVRLGDGAQGAVEGVRVRVGEPGQGEAGEVFALGGRSGRRAAGGDGGETLAVGFDQDVAADALAGEPGQVGEPAS